ncbi:MAG: tetratricopeptide repeat protein, partial [Flavobacteriaceae bacterium]|nr:tetratricopeptide repeat protein [Flavobacteriaceae bacterium]
MRTLTKTYLLYSIFCLLGLNLIAQEDLTEAEIESIQDRIEFDISFAQNNIDNKEFYKAQDDLEQALELAKQINDNKSIGLIYSKMGKLYYIQENPEEATKILVKAIEKQRFAKDNINIAETYKTLGLVYLKQKKEYNNAIDYFNSAEVIFENEDLHSYEAETKMYKADAYFILKNYDLAQDLYEEVISLSKRYQHNQLLSTSYLKLGQTKAALGNVNEAENFANLGFQIAEKNGFIDILSIGYKVKSDIKEAAGEYKASNTLLKKHLKLNDSLLKVKRSHLAEDKKLEFLYDNPVEYQKEREADLQKEANSSWLEKLTTILSIALITILSLLTLSLYKNNNIRLKSNNILHKKNAELTIAMEKAELATKTKANFLSTVTHELRTPLYAVTGLTNMLLEENPKPEQVQHLKSLKFSGDYLLTFINDILQINKIEANKVDIEPEVFNLKKKVEN